MAKRVWPSGVVASLIDFSDGRPAIWPNLDPARYVVHEVAETSALVTEASLDADIWAVERYDWSTPGRVAWLAEESNFCAPAAA